MADEPGDEPTVEASHLIGEPYTDDERIEFPDWYDDTINVGDVANAEADQ
jgi:hypothetical protein